MTNKNEVKVEDKMVRCLDCKKNDRCFIKTEGRENTWGTCDSYIPQAEVKEVEKAVEMEREMKKRKNEVQK